MHGNARLTTQGRRILVERIGAGRPAAHVAAEMGISRTTAYRWWRRYQSEGEAGLFDRSSRPHTCPHRTPIAVEAQIIELRQTRKLGPARIGLIPHAGLDGLASPGASRVEPAPVDGPTHRTGDPPLREVGSW